MKSLKIVLSLIALGLVASAPLANAQGKGKKGGAMPTPQAQVDRIDQAVTLTDAQKPQVLEIYTKLAEDMKAVDPADRATKGRELMTAAREKVMDLLSTDQKAKMPAEKAGKKKKGGN